MFGDADAVLVHPLFLIFMSVATTATVTWAITKNKERSTERAEMADLLKDFRRLVLPHFEAVGPGEEDVSLPGRVARIEHEIHPNDGRSMRDQIIRLERKVVPPDEIPPPLPGET